MPLERLLKTIHSRVFISHNKKDKEFASQIAVFLATEKISTWFDEWEISAGDSILDEIENGLKSCTHFVILWSKNAATSNWVREELKSVLIEAIEKKSIKIIPILLDDTEKPPLLRDKKHLVYQGGNEKDRDDIIEAIVGNKPKTNFAQAIVKMYNKIIFGKMSHPAEVHYCPGCGSDDLERGTVMDYKRDDEYYSIECKKCGWADSGEM